jgi:hypothetical protein
MLHIYPSSVRSIGADEWMPSNNGWTPEGILSEEGGRFPTQMRRNPPSCSFSSPRPSAFSFDDLMEHVIHNHRVSGDLESELPDDDDVVIWHLLNRDDLDAYRVTKGSTVLGEFTGRSVGSAVFQAAIEHAEPGRAVWLKDERGFRRLNPTGPVT